MQDTEAGSNEPCTKGNGENVVSLSRALEEDAKKKRAKGEEEKEEGTAPKKSAFSQERGKVGHPIGGRPKGWWQPLLLLARSLLLLLWGEREGERERRVERVKKHESVEWTIAAPSLAVILFVGSKSIEIRGCNDICNIIAFMCQNPLSNLKRLWACKRVHATDHYYAKSYET